MRWTRGAEKQIELIPPRSAREVRSQEEPGEALSGFRVDRPDPVRRARRGGCSGSVRLGHRRRGPCGGGPELDLRLIRESPTLSGPWAAPRFNGAAAP